MNYRFENFGGIISTDTPPLLIFVDRNYMRELGLGESELWKSDESIGLLSAPTEIHFSITEKCSLRCQHCYTDGGDTLPDELEIEKLKRALDIFAEMKVFRLAFAGGDGLERAELFELAEYARSKGIIPNFTVSGINMTPEIAKKMKVFGQVNVSIDGAGKEYGIFREQEMFEFADNAVDMLLEAGVPTGINCLVGRRNYDGIENLFKYAAEKKVNHISFLRFKPAGRAKTLYDKEKTTHLQNISLFPMLKKLSKKYKLEIKIDCSFMPMIFWHDSAQESFKNITRYGCEAGNVHWLMQSNGIVTPCAFLNNAPSFSIFDIKSNPHQVKYFERIKNWIKSAPQPCSSCDHLNICKGGCHGVAEFVTGSFYESDPDCPFVVEYKKANNFIANQEIENELN